LIVIEKYRKLGFGLFEKQKNRESPIKVIPCSRNCCKIL